MTGKIIDDEKTIKILNDLNDENEQLQTHLSQLAKSNREGVKKVQSLAKENKKLKQENNKIKSSLFQKMKELNDTYQKSAKAGMPTGGIIGELDLLEEICEEMGWLKVSALGVESTLIYYDKGEKND